MRVGGWDVKHPLTGGVSPKKDRSITSVGWEGGKQNDL
jgi:hypothetical protein